MKVLYFSHVFGSTTTTFIYNDVVAVNEEPGFEAHYLCLKRENEASKTFKNVYVVPFKRNKIYNKLLWELETRDLHLRFNNRSFKKEVQPIIDNIKPDLIHCNFGYEALYLLDNCFNPDTRYIIQFHGYDASKKIKSKAYIGRLNYYAALPNVQLLVVSEHMKSELLKSGVKPLNEPPILYYGVDTEFFHNAVPRIKNDTFTFLQVSGLVPKKGHKYTMDAYRLFKDQHPTIKSQLVIAGKDFMNGAVQAYAYSVLAKEEVKFIGEVNALQIKELMQDADCFLHHSVTAEDGDKEGVPNAIIEAMAMDLPVISTFHAGIPELIKHNQNGLMVKEKDVPAYAQAMLYVTENVNSFKPRQSIEEKFSLKNHVKQLMAIYQKQMKLKPEQTLNA